MQYTHVSVCCNSCNDLLRYRVRPQIHHFLPAQFHCLHLFPFGAEHFPSSTNQLTNQPISQSIAIHFFACRNNSKLPNPLTPCLHFFRSDIVQWFTRPRQLNCGFPPSGVLPSPSWGYDDRQATNLFSPGNDLCFAVSRGLSENNSGSIGQTMEREEIQKDRSLSGQLAEHDSSLNKPSCFSCDGNVIIKLDTTWLLVDW